jgi:hypothetical protein
MSRPRWPDSTNSPSEIPGTIQSGTSRVRFPNGDQVEGKTFSCQLRIHEKIGQSAREVRFCLRQLCSARLPPSPTARASRQSRDRFEWRPDHVHLAGASRDFSALSACSREPTMSAESKPFIAIALSGGGARAMAFHLGCLCQPSPNLLYRMSTMSTPSWPPCARTSTRGNPQKRQRPDAHRHLERRQLRPPAAARPG